MKKNNYSLFPFFVNREIVSNALALGEIQSSKFDADLSQHEYTPEAPVTHYARYTREKESYNCSFSSCGDSRQLKAWKVLFLLLLLWWWW